MPISVSRLDSPMPCTSGSERHRTDSSAVRTAELRVDIGDTSNWLCIPCAKDLFTCTGVLIISITGQSVAELAGIKKKRRKR